jgi:pimeloyl-ACP methyl ester carboxylesterase
MARHESILFELAVEGRAYVDPAAGLQTAPKLTRRYVGEPGRQIHLIEGGRPTPAASRDLLARPPLACLHAATRSSASFTPFLSAMARRRHVLALDTPGHGGSDRPEQRLDIAGYARSLGDALDEALARSDRQGGDGKIDLFGHSTGALIAVELARRRPERVRRLVLMNAPYFVGAEQAVWRHRLARPHDLTDDVSQLEARWRALVTDREWGVSLARSFEAFIDEMRAYPHDWWVQDAAFAFDVETAFSEVHQPVLILNPANAFAQAARRAVWALPDGHLMDLPLVRNAPFDVGVEELAERMDEFLSKS